MAVTSTYGILLMTLSRYIAVIYPFKYKIVRGVFLLRLPPPMRLRFYLVVCLFLLIMSSDPDQILKSLHWLKV